jgi:hypothetical protein
MNTTFITKLLFSHEFRFIILPFVGITLSIMLKYCSQNDKYCESKKEDFALGIQLGVSCLIAFLSYTIGYCSKLISMKLDSNTISGEILSTFSLMACIFLALLSTSLIVRKWGWKNNQVLTIFIGFFFPFITALFSYSILAYWIGKGK